MRYHLRTSHLLQHIDFENKLQQCNRQVNPNKTLIDPGSLKFLSNLPSTCKDKPVAAISTSDHQSMTASSIPPVTLPSFLNIPCVSSLPDLVVTVPVF